MKDRVQQWPALAERIQNALVRQVGTCTDFELFMRAFKAEQVLETWVRGGENLRWQSFKYYLFCASSGSLGPKRQEGDHQIPEGIYYIDRFNPKSKYHLSLGLNYPNASDRILGHSDMPGSDIFIHGGCETVGCIAITDAGIEEVYVLASLARDKGQKNIPVHIYPFRFDEENWNSYGPEFPQHQELWRSLEGIYLGFERSRQLPEVAVLDSGQYVINPSW